MSGAPDFFDFMCTRQTPRTGLEHFFPLKFLKLTTSLLLFLCGTWIAQAEGYWVVDSKGGVYPFGEAIDHGGTTATGCPTTDQRGLARPDETADAGACDMGAYESQGVG